MKKTLPSMFINVICFACQLRSFKMVYTEIGCVCVYVCLWLLFVFLGGGGGGGIKLVSVQPQSQFQNLISLISFHKRGEQVGEERVGIYLLVILW